MFVSVHDYDRSSVETKTRHGARADTARKMSCATFGAAVKFSDGADSVVSVVTARHGHVRLLPPVGLRQHELARTVAVRVPLVGGDAQVHVVLGHVVHVVGEAVLLAVLERVARGALEVLVLPVHRLDVDVLPSVALAHEDLDVLLEGDDSLGADAAGGELDLDDRVRVAVVLVGTVLEADGALLGEGVGVGAEALEVLVVAVRAAAAGGDDEGVDSVPVVARGVELLERALADGAARWRGRVRRDVLVEVN